MKTVFVVAAMLAITSSANAESFFKIEQPCGSKCEIHASTAKTPLVGGVRFRDFSPPDYESKTVINSPFGTSTYIYRSYRR